MGSARAWCRWPRRAAIRFPPLELLAFRVPGGREGHGAGDVRTPSPGADGGTARLRRAPYDGKAIESHSGRSIATPGRPRTAMRLGAARDARSRARTGTPSSRRGSATGCTSSRTLVRDPGRLPGDAGRARQGTERGKCEDCPNWPAVPGPCAPTALDSMAVEGEAVATIRSAPSSSRVSCGARKRRCPTTTRPVTRALYPERVAPCTPRKAKCSAGVRKAARCATWRSGGLMRRATPSVPGV